MSKLPPLNPGLEPVWLPYGRKSHPNERDDQKTTEREQRESALAWAKQQIARAGRGTLDTKPWEFDDDTGLNADRPAYRRRLARARELRMQGRQVIWLVRQFDRLGRDAEELHRCYKELCSLDVELHDVSMGGYVSPQVFPYLVANAHVGSVTIGANVTRTNNQVRRDGWWRPGRRPWGYAIAPATPAQQAAGSPKVVLAEHPDEAGPCRQAWVKLAKGANLHEVERWVAGLTVAERGVNPKGARTLAHQALQTMFRNPLYKGCEPDGTVGHWPALVTPELWDAVQARLARAGRVPAQASHDYLLTGLAWCGLCDDRGQPARMSGQTKSARDGTLIQARRYYCQASKLGARCPVTCHFSVLMAGADQAVLRQVAPAFDQLLGEDRAELVREIARQLGERHGGQLGELETRLKEAEAKITLAKNRSDVLLEKLEDRKITDAEFEQRMERHRALRAEGEAQKLHVEGQLAVATGRTGPPGRRRLNGHDVLDMWDQARAAWADAGADVPSRRDTLGNLVSRVVLRRGEYGQVEAHVTWTEDGELLAAAAQLLVRPSDEPAGGVADATAAG